MRVIEVLLAVAATASSSEGMGDDMKEAATGGVELDVVNAEAELEAVERTVAAATGAPSRTFHAATATAPNPHPPPPAGMAPGKIPLTLASAIAFLTEANEAWSVPHSLSHLRAGSEQSKSSCECHPNSQCTYRNNIHLTEQPVDPMTWCAVRGSKCIEAAREVHVVDKTPPEVAAVEQHGIPTPKVVGWKHCGDDAHFDFAHAEEKRARVVAASAHRAATATPTEPTDTATPLRHAAPTPYDPVALLHGPKAKMKPHYLFQVDCHNDGTGANAQYWWFMLATAVQTRLNLVWNPAQFVSENSPQYEFSWNYACKTFGTKCVPPGDLYTPMGLYAAGRPVAPPSVDKRELFRRIDAGQLATYVVDGDCLGKLEDELLFLSRRINTVVASFKVPHVVIVKRCLPKPIAGMVSAPGLHGWIRHAYEQTRRVLRPHYPPLIERLPRNKFLIVTTVRRGDTTPADWHFHSNKWFTPMEFYVNLVKNIFSSGAGLSCSNTAVVVVSETKKEFVAEFDALNAVGPKGSCWHPAFSEYEDEDTEASVRSLFRDFDYFSAADIFVPSRHSAFSMLAKAFLHPDAVRFVAESSCVRGFNMLMPLDHGANAIQADVDTACFDKAAFKEVWHTRGYEKMTRQLVQLNRVPAAPGFEFIDAAGLRYCQQYDRVGDEFFHYSNLRRCATACAKGKDLEALHKLEAMVKGSYCNTIEAAKEKLLKPESDLPIGKFWTDQRLKQCPSRKYLTLNYAYTVAAYLSVAAPRDKYNWRATKGGSLAESTWVKDPSKGEGVVVVFSELVSDPEYFEKIDPFFYPKGPPADLKDSVIASFVNANGESMAGVQLTKIFPGLKEGSTFRYKLDNQGPTVRVKYLGNMDQTDPASTEVSGNTYVVIDPIAVDVHGAKLDVRPEMMSPDHPKEGFLGAPQQFCVPVSWL